MNLPKVLGVAAAALSLAALGIMPAGANSVRFAQYTLTDMNDLLFHYSGGGVGASITTTTPTVDTDFTFRAGAGALNNVVLDATMLFSVTNGTGSFNNFGVVNQNFHDASISFTSTAADVKYGLAIGTNLLTMVAVSSGNAITMTGVDTTTTPALSASAANKIFPTTITFTSAVDVLANNSGSQNAFGVQFENAGPDGFTVPVNGAAAPFFSNDAGNFATAGAVPELSSLVPFGVLLSAGSLFAVRRRRA